MSSLPLPMPLEPPPSSRRLPRRFEALPPSAQLRPVEPVPLMKGIGFANVKRYVLTQHGISCWDATLALLDADDRSCVEAAVAVGWYDVLVFARLIRAIDRACGKGNLELLREIGAYEVEQDSSRVLRTFLRVLSPANIFRAEGKLWSHFHTAGRWTSIEVPGGVDATLTGWAVDAALCRELAGYLEKLLEYAGAKAAHVGHSECQAHGGAQCLFRYRWK